jgi:hypothetical protein
MSRAIQLKKKTCCDSRRLAAVQSVRFDVSGDRRKVGITGVLP